MTINQIIKPHLGFRLLGVLLILTMIYFGIKNNNYLSNNGLYTVGKAKEIELGPRSSLYLKYEFEFEGHRYEGTFPVYSPTKAQIGNYYVVQFLADDPSVNSIFEDKPTNITIDETAYSGYIKFPDKYLMKNKDILIESDVYQ